MSIGLSIRRLHRNGLIDLIHRILRRAKLTPRFLRLRLARDRLLSDIRRVVTAFRRLHSLNIGLTVSSFNANCSSLDCLGHVPISCIGVSRTFVHKLKRNDRSTTVAQTVVTVTRNLSLGIITRNIRHTRRLTFLRTRHYSRIRNCLVDHPIRTTSLTRLLQGSTGPL